MTIYDLINVWLDPSEQAVVVWEYHDEGCSRLYEGTLENVPDEIQDAVVVNIDNLEDDKVLHLAIYE